MNEAWFRLNQVIEVSGLSVNGFAKSIGLKRAENLYRIKNGKNSISKELVDLITIKYCNLSKAWLLTGEGNMYLNKQGEIQKGNYVTKKVPFYDSAIFDLGKLDENALPEPLYYMEIPTLVNCDFAAVFIGDSMKPEIPSGSIVTLKEVELSLILPGEMYMIVTDKYVTIKYVRIVNEDNNLLRLVPENKASYDEMYINKSLIKKLYLVKGVISARVL